MITGSAGTEYFRSSTYLVPAPSPLAFENLDVDLVSPYSYDENLQQYFDNQPYLSRPANLGWHSIHPGP